MNRKGFRIAALSSLAFALAWAVVARAIGAPFILPGPAAVLRDATALFSDPRFYGQLAATGSRGLLAFALSVALSLALGGLSGISDGAAAALKPWLSVVKSTPVVSIILIALLWFGSSAVPVFAAILMTLPVMTEALSKGMRQSDPKLLEMARIYRFRKRDALFRIRLGTALPYFLAGAGTALGLTWKVVVAGEILALPRHGLGSSIQTARIQLETVRVFSLTAMAVVLSMASEYLFSRLSRHFSATQSDPFPESQARP